MSFTLPSSYLRLASSTLMVLATALYAAAPGHAQLDLETIMQAPEWFGRAPSNPYWSADSGSILFSRSMATAGAVWLASGSWE